VTALDTRGPVLFVHAHPDDETISTGALIAELRAGGTEVFLLTATRGERGDVVPGPLSGLEGTDALAEARESELQCASDALGVTERFWLGHGPARAHGLRPRRYRDSGMTWIRPGLAGPADDVPHDALAVAPLPEVAADLAALIAHLHPTLVVSYDNGGGYGHPDHVQSHRAARSASGSHGVTFAEIVQAPEPQAEWFVLDRWIDTVTNALRCHSSQLTVHGGDIVHCGGQREPIRTSVGLRVLGPQSVSLV